MKKVLHLLVEPLTSRKTKKAVEQSFTANIEQINFDITSVLEAGRTLGIEITNEVNEAIEKTIANTFTETSDLFDARYFIAYNLKNIVTDNRPVYKVPVSITEFEKMKTYLKSTVTVV